MLTIPRSWRLFRVAGSGTATFAVWWSRWCGVGTGAWRICSRRLYRRYFCVLPVYTHSRVPMSPCGVDSRFKVAPMHQWCSERRKEIRREKCPALQRAARERPPGAHPILLSQQTYFGERCCARIPVPGILGHFIVISTGRRAARYGAGFSWLGSDASLLHPTCSV